MSIKPNLTTSLRQHLVLTPQMRQRIELLSMTKLELHEMITQEMTENPVLELEEAGPGETTESLTGIEESLYDSPAPPPETNTQSQVESGNAQEQPLPTPAASLDEAEGG